MGFVAIVSDSTAGLPEDYVVQHNIQVVPLYVKIGDVSYRDGVDISAAEFYERLPHCDALPTTSQPSVGDFAAAYQALAQEGATDIVSVHLSSGISGTLNSARLAAEQVDVPVHLVDTYSAGAAHRLVVESGVQALEGGADGAGVVAAMQAVVAVQKTNFTVDTLEYLYKGGRIGGAAALFGSLLKLKPILYLPDGKIDALERVRTTSKTMARMAELMGEWFGNEQPVQALIMEAACPDRAQLVAELLPRYVNLAHVRTMILTPVIGAHIGVGTLGIACCPVDVCPVAPDAV